jgi:prepilin-type N-terminal cleavage/methylation domain-containing protein/prepilin-type processing-associated H-X9-DG protein
MNGPDASKLEQSWPCARGFTLVELLVVVGIVALLIGILMPVLGRAREAARQVVCMSQMRELSVATEIYCKDNRNHWPGVVLTLAPFTELLEDKWDPRLIVCPSGESGGERTRSYSVNAYLLYNGWEKRTEVPRIHETLLYVEEHETSIDNEHFAVYTNVWWNMISARHTRGSNMVFTDGHIEHWKFSDKRTGVFVGYYSDGIGNPDLDKINRAQCPPMVP